MMAITVQCCNSMLILEHLICSSFIHPSDIQGIPMNKSYIGLESMVHWNRIIVHHTKHNNFAIDVVIRTDFFNHHSLSQETTMPNMKPTQKKKHLDSHKFFSGCFCICHGIWPITITIIIFRQTAIFIAACMPTTHHPSRYFFALVLVPLSSQRHHKIVVGG